MEKFIYKNEYRYPTSIMLNVTDDCNLACRYCFVEQHPHYMTLDIAIQAIDWVYNNYIEKKKYFPPHEQINVNVNFFGGEPMLMYKKIIVPVVLYAEKKYNGLFTFGITTNCTLLTKDSIDFFANHNIGVLCSIDGAETTQCFNRPCKNGDNSFKLIEKNIKYLLTKIPNATFRSTAYPPTLKYTYQNYLYAESLGFRTYALCPDELSKWTNKDIKELKKQFNQIFLHQTKQQQIKENNYMKITSASSIQFMIDTLIMNRDFPEDSIFRCGLGVNTCAVGWDGKIYGCQQDVSLNKKNIMYLGTLEKGIQKKKHIKLLKKYLKDAKQIQYPRNYFQCHKCQLLPYCKNGTESGCPSTNLTLFKNSHKMSKIKCEFTKILFKEILLLKIISIQLSQQAKEE